MAELPFMKFFPADYLRDTDILSLTTQGAWMRILCSMWHPARKGILSLRIEALSRLLHADQATTGKVLTELYECRVADIEWNPDGEHVTITSRRIVKDWEAASTNRQILSESGRLGAEISWANRRAKGEAKEKPKAPATASANGLPNGHPITPANGNPEARSQKPEEAASPAPAPAPEPSTTNAQLAEMLCLTHPKHCLTGPALAAALAALKRHLFEDILAGTCRYAEAVATWTEAEKLQFVTNPERFFNEDTWRQPAENWKSRKGMNGTQKKTMTDAEARAALGGRAIYLDQQPDLIQ